MDENKEKLTPRQRRTINEFKRVLHDVVDMTEDAPELLNLALALMLGMAGTQIGAMTAAQAGTPEALHASTIKAARHIQEEAFKAYGKYLAMEAAANGRPS